MYTTGYFMLQVVWRDESIECSSTLAMINLSSAYCCILKYEWLNCSTVVANFHSVRWLRPKFHFETTLHVSSESRRACRAVLFQRGGRRTSYSARLYKFSRFYALAYTNFIWSNEI